MNRFSLSLLVLLTPLAASPVTAWAGEKIAGVNTYMLNERQIPFGNGAGYWSQDNHGTFEVTEGPMTPGPVECHGSGFWDEIGQVTGGGVCIFGDEGDQQFWRYTATPGGPTAWVIVHATGKYKGASGKGISTTRRDTQNRIAGLRITDWEGEIELPK